MYLSMARKKICPGTILVCLLALTGKLPAMETTIELGRQSAWTEIQSFDGVIETVGRWGLNDLTLDMAEYAPDGQTDLLFHFNRPGEADSAGAYKFKTSPPPISPDLFALGKGSALFQATGDGALVSIPSGSLFAPGAVWQDFTLEFWLHPSTLTRTETVFSWKGAEMDGTGITIQSVIATIRDRRVTWDFRNFFTLPDGKRLSLTLGGIAQLLPRAWHHHLLRYDSSLGLLEYLLDGVPEAIVHTTQSGREGGSVAVPRIGIGFPGELIIGSDFSGFLDELRLTKRFVDSPSIKPFAAKSGTAVSKIIDLGYTGTRISRIQSVYSTPSDSSVAFYYKVSDTWTGPKTLATTAGWIQFDPAKGFGDAVRGRYVQVMVELFPDGRKSNSPNVSSLAVVFEPNLPPTPPAGIVVTPGNGQVTVTWRKVNDLNVKGYRVYFGDAPHTYLHADSPLDAGNSTRLEIKNLENGNLYYFTVTAYDDSDPPQESGFSAESSSRPSRIYP
jgi:hypothetical protein